MNRAIAIATAALLWSGAQAVLAQDTPVEARAEPEVLRAEVISKPGPEQTDPLFPKIAREAGVSGGAEVECVVGLDTRLTDCKLLSEEPVGYGIGEAALAIAPLHRVRPPEVDGEPVAGTTIRQPYTFRTEPPAEAASPDADGAPRVLVRAMIVLAWPVLFAVAMLGAMAYAWFAPPPAPRRSARRLFT